MRVIIDVLMTAFMVALVTVILPALWQVLKQRIDREKYDLLMEFISTFVEAAEQLFEGEHQGKHRKQYVYDQLQQKGVTLTYEEFDAMVESAVYKLTKNTKDN